MRPLTLLKNVLQAAIHSDTKPSDLLHKICASFPDIQWIGLAEKTEKDKFRLSAAAGDGAAKLEGCEFFLGEGFLGHVAATGLPGYWPDVSKDPRAAFFTRHGVHPASVAAYPLVWRHEVMGVFFATFSGKISEEVKNETLDALAVVSSMLAARMRIHALEDLLRVREIRLSSILELSKAMTTVKEVKNVFYILLDMSLNLVQGPFSCLIGRRPGESAIDVLSRGISSHQAAKYGRELADTYIGRMVHELENGALPVVRRVEDVPVIECPLFYQNEVLAVLAVAVGEETEIEPFQQMLSVLSLMGGAAIQRILGGPADHRHSLVELIERVSAYWNKETYDRMMEAQELAAGFAATLGLKDGEEILKQIAVFSLYDMDFITALLPAIDPRVVEGLRTYHLLSGAASDAAGDLSVYGQILVLADHHAGHTDIQADRIDHELRQKFASYLLMKDIHRQQIVLHHRNADSPAALPGVKFSGLTLSGGTLPEPLTARELEVLSMLAMGLGNKEIAQKLFISEHTVKNHLTKIFQKLGVNDRAQAIAFVYQFLR
ncbi:hypothetical protein BSNK01_30890 [Bacillaceae bacterium]